MHVIGMCIIYMYVQVKILSQGDYVGEYLSLSMTLNVSMEGASAPDLLAGCSSPSQVLEKRTTCELGWYPCPLVDDVA